MLLKDLKKYKNLMKSNIFKLVALKIHKTKIGRFENLSIFLFKLKVIGIYENGRAKLDETELEPQNIEKELKDKLTNFKIEGI